jgi:hypothetical protein
MPCQKVCTKASTQAYPELTRWYRAVRPAADPICPESYIGWLDLFAILTTAKQRRVALARLKSVRAFYAGFALESHIDDRNESVPMTQSPAQWQRLWDSVDCLQNR